MPQVKINGFDMHYEDRGTGKPVVLVHGFPLDGRIFGDQLAALSSKCRVIVPDLRGFGRSRPAGPLSMDAAADDVHALMEALGLVPFTLGGLSMGGYIALAHVFRHPRDLSGLILIDTRAGADTAEGKEGRNKMIGLLKSTGPKAVTDAMFPKMLAAPSDALAAQFRNIMESQSADAIEQALVGVRDRADFTARLPEIRMPTLIIVGEKDAITPVEQSKIMNDYIAGSALKIVPGAGHVSTMEQPAVVNDAIAGFVAS